MAALEESGALHDMERRGIQQLCYIQVDNPLVRVADPEFLGYQRLADAEVATQVVAKASPRDPLGNVVHIEGQTRIIEYSDLNRLPDEIVLRKQADGTPVFWAGSTGVHIIDVALLRRCSASDEALPFHLAEKQVSHIDDDGRQIEPREPNAIKFERFIFDLLPAARRVAVVEVDARERFAPVKNAPGKESDTPELAAAQMVALHSRWLRDAGAMVDEGVAVEISPSFALDEEHLKANIELPLHVAEPRYFAR